MGATVTNLHELERRIRAAQPQEPEVFIDAAEDGGVRVPGVKTQTDAHRRANAVARFEQDRDRALADPATTALKRARLTFEGAGISAAALAVLSGVSRQTIVRAERDPASVSAATLRRLAAALHVAPSRVT